MELTPDIITQFGLIQKVSTGHAYLDMLLVMLLPLVLRNLLPILHGWFQEIWNMERGTKGKVYERQIEYKKNYEYYWCDNQDGPSNQILQKAVINFINTKIEVLRELPNADFQLKKKHVEQVKRDMTGEDEDEPDTDIDDHDYDVNVVPPVGVWIDLKNGVKFMRQLEETEEKKKNVKTTYFLQALNSSAQSPSAKAGSKAVHADGVKLIEDFIAEALELYRKQQATRIDYSRYLYIPVLSGSMARAAQADEGANAPSAIYKRYKLSEEKTFASFFHPDKDPIIGLVNQFQEKKSKFGIAGYPQKLGFLLYGPPGTGKTSFIKALAQYTKRSVISIPLTKIHTNQELMDIMFDQKIKVDNADSSMSLPYNKTIFVMEDVDAASAVVQRRAETSTSDSTVAALQEMHKQAERKRKKKAEKKEEACDEPVKMEGSDGEEGGKSKGKAIGPMPAFGRSFYGGDDDLNLAGLLNVLDGVVDTPNRIVIMTTNHPEKLDPALIRPGRINKKIYMGRMCTEEALSMMVHYFGTIAEATKSQLRAVFVDEALSPAELETMCADFETAEQLVQQLATKFTFAERSVAAENVSLDTVVENCDTAVAAAPAMVKQESYVRTA